MCAQIKEKREVAKGTLLVIFDLLGREVDFKPGQVLLGHAPRPALRRRKGAAPAHHRRHLTD
jgi:NAD(P)H-flavin reductase